MWTVHNPLAGTRLFAQALSTEWDLCVAAGALFAVLGLGLWAIFKVKQWREKDDALGVLPIDQQLAHYQEMVDEGELDPQEFARIKAKLEGQISSEPPPIETPANQPPDGSNP